MSENSMWKKEKDNTHTSQSKTSQLCITQDDM